MIWSKTKTKNKISKKNRFNFNGLSNLPSRCVSNVICWTIGIEYTACAQRIKINASIVT